MIELLPHQICELIEYDPLTGELRWKKRDRKCFNSLYAGKLIAFSDRKGALNFSLFRKHYLAHRVAWAIVYGKWPSNCIDHIDGDYTNNRIANLRDVPLSVNQRNRRKRKDNSSGATGVFWSADRKKWIAQITLGGATSHIGIYVSKEDAITARKNAEKGHGFTDRHGI